MALVRRISASCVARRWRRSRRSLTHSVPRRTGRSGAGRTATARSPAFTAPAAWPEALTQRWKVEVGTGYATPLVVGNRVYMFSRHGDNETMSALDADSGKVLWQTGLSGARSRCNSAAVRHGPGPKSTPVVRQRAAVHASA